MGRVGMNDPEAGEVNLTCQSSWKLIHKREQGVMKKFEVYISANGKPLTIDADSFSIEDLHNNLRFWRVEERAGGSVTVLVAVFASGHWHIVREFAIDRLDVNA